MTTIHQTLYNFITLLMQQVYLQRMAPKSLDLLYKKSFSKI